MSERKEWISPLAHLALTPLMRRALCAEAAERLRGPRRGGEPVEGLKDRADIVAPTKSATKSAPKGCPKIPSIVPKILVPKIPNPENVPKIGSAVPKIDDVPKIKGRGRPSSGLSSAERKRALRAARKSEE